jgi:hypothetical protein
MKTTKQFVRSQNGSALIMTIVLTVLLAAVAVMFLAVARMDKASTSNITQSKMLDAAAESILAIINKELVYDTPGVAKMTDCNDETKYPQYFDYKDYPDPCDPWLASAVPYCDANSWKDKDAYKWRQISDITGYLAAHNFPTRNIKVKPVGLNKPTAAKPFEVVREYPIFGIDPNGYFLIGDSIEKALDGVSADADGDGIADSKWFELSNLRLPTGRVLAAVRIIDNAAMVNTNTAYELDTTATDPNKIDGSSQMHVNLAGLLKTTDSIDDLHDARCDYRTVNDANFHNDVICDFNTVPAGNYLPFDSSDELELRYRYCINSKFRSRFEDKCWHTTDANSGEGKLYDGSTGWGILEWGQTFKNFQEPNSTRRHLLTTYNCDRLIDPNGNEMLNINEANALSLYNLFKKYLINPEQAGQAAVNVIDSRDSDSDVNVVTFEGKTYYGLEKPCIYISEIVYKQIRKSGPVIPPAEPVMYKSYAIELYRPYVGDSNDKWWLLSSTILQPIVWNGSSKYHVVIVNNTDPPLTVDPTASSQPISTSPLFSNNQRISLVREVNGKALVVDLKRVPNSFIPTDNNNVTKSLERDITDSKCIRRLWQSPADTNGHTLGKANDFKSTDPNCVQAYPADKPFTSIGEIGMILRNAHYYVYDASNPDASPEGIPGLPSGLIKDSAVKINIADPSLASMFNFLTAVDTRRENETRVKGRVNINTAPASVIAQLPWVSQNPDGVVDVNLAQAIVAYRDSNDVNGFENIGQLMNVPGMNRYATDNNDLKTFPDLSAEDTAIDDYEERDVIFSRISNLATVRSDVFTAYILVRVGVDGPQKRYIAILDRSEVKKPTDKVKIRAFQQVPDAR